MGPSDRLTDSRPASPSAMEEAMENQFPLLKDIPHEEPKDTVPLPNFVQAMAIPVLRDYTKAPPPLPDTPDARLQWKLDQIDRHAAAINHNFHFMAQREARRIAGLCEQEEQEMRELNDLDDLPVYGLGASEDPHSTLDLDVLLNQEPDGQPERYALPQGFTQREFKIPATSGLLPRKVLQIETLSLFQLALNNMEGRAGAAQQQKEAARRKKSMEMAKETARRLGAAQPDSNPGPSKADGQGEAMDTSED
ncbi:uncharacterized protein B0I36DRAFT_28828 [Microdochium trichocladiopsis]|uniref:Uncharacterized protein n=1 Tax=Microdochium trichocladiopsis TaxID=1682393 RepID=A0A9P9BNP9_9PEZI|nr:uncharacterized protein B0I36DRAFT_28828 [Microdochium trichocladiopsis]KAH7021088.1 hypothetical protein B0I36DRAFT_28828 [Microdochium trichocladiopsis]